MPVGRALELALEIGEGLARAHEKGIVHRDTPAPSAGRRGVGWYQGMRDVVVDIRAARRALESGSIVALPGAATSGIGLPPAALSPQAATAQPMVPSAVSVAEAAPSVGRRPRVLWFGAAAVAIVVVAAAIAVFVSRRPAPIPATSGSKPSVAVLYFENNTGNASLDWLRTGLTDMVVTDLSQSPNIEVLGTDRLYQILSELKRADDRVISFDTVQEVARRVGVQTVVLGSYVKSGDVIRINVKLQEAKSGRILTSERVEAVGENNLFTMVDDLTRRIKANFQIPQGPAAAVKGLLRPAGSSALEGNDLDRELKDVTTSSVDAYRYYAEGYNLHMRGRYAQAIPLYDKAVEVDPNFALALAKLATAHGNLFHVAESREFAKRAMDRADRLTPRERLYIEAVFYSRRPETIDRAIEAYTRAIELYPDYAAARNNVATLYIQLGRTVRKAREGRRRLSTWASRPPRPSCCSIAASWRARWPQPTARGPTPKAIHRSGARWVFARSPWRSWDARRTPTRV